ncbi:DUF2076 family protein [Xylophilus sp. Kf1]|nr:DUF2076 family protein [Xylophilus sp. Kf1]
MTPQERSLLDDFLSRLQAAGPVHQDPEASAMIHSRLDGQRDAAYLLVQRSLLMDRALAEANHQITTLRQQLASAGAGGGGGGGSFLGGATAAPEGFGRAPSQAYSPEPRAEQRYDAPAPQQAEAQSWRNRWFGGGAPAQGQPAPAVAAAGGSSFLGRAATTAAGVAGGMFLFNGIEHLMGGGHGGGGGNAGGNTGNSLFGDNGNGNDGGSLSGPMTENITENVFVRDDGAGGDRQGFLDDGTGGGSDAWASGDDYADGGGDDLA